MPADSHDLPIADLARTAEDVIEAGRRALLRSARDDEPARQAIDAGADWLLERARELRRP